jgi:Family of unknown function (DUF6221)
MDDARGCGTVAGLGPSHRDDLDGLVTFLLARITEDEMIALSAIGSGEVVELKATEQVAQHMCRHDPDRVLREAAAKRAIVALWATGARAEKAGRGRAVERVPVAVIVHLVSAYSDHPDFDGDWLGPVLTGQ